MKNLLLNTSDINIHSNKSRQNSTHQKKQQQQDNYSIHSVQNMSIYPEQHDKIISFQGEDFQSSERQPFSTNSDKGSPTFNPLLHIQQYSQNQNGSISFSVFEGVIRRVWQQLEEMQLQLGMIQVLSERQVLMEQRIDNLEALVRLDIKRPQSPAIRTTERCWHVSPKSLVLEQQIESGAMHSSEQLEHVPPQRIQKVEEQIQQYLMKLINIDERISQLMKSQMQWTEGLNYQQKSNQINSLKIDYQQKITTLNESIHMNVKTSSESPYGLDILKEQVYQIDMDMLQIFQQFKPLLSIDYKVRKIEDKIIQLFDQVQYHQQIKLKKTNVH